MGRRKVYTEEELREHKLAYAKAYRKTPRGRCVKREQERRRKSRKRQRAKLQRIYAPDYICPLIKYADKVASKEAWIRQMAEYTRLREVKAAERQRQLDEQAAAIAAKETRRQRAKEAREAAGQAKLAEKEAKRFERERQRAEYLLPENVEARAAEKRRKACESARRRKDETYAKIKADPGKYLDLLFGNAIRSSLRKRKSNKRGRAWQSVVGYTLDELKARIEPLFQPGMTWDNYGDWHIDHRIPKAAFDYASPEDPGFKECWALENLQPLWAAENWSKHARI